MTPKAALPALLLALTLTLPAQPAPQTSALQTQAAAAIARNLIQSPVLADKAWGTYLAAGVPDPSLQETLISELRLATDPAYRHVIFDSLIRSGATVPTGLLLTFDADWRNPVLILLSRNPGAETEAPLLALLDDARIDTGQWTLASNLLLRIDSKALFRKTLQQLAITHDIIATDHRAGFGKGGSCGSGEFVSPDPAGFPPISRYFLGISPQPGAIVAAEGPRVAYYLRALSSSQHSGWEMGCGEDRDEARLGYLAAARNSTVDQVRKIFRPTDTFEWKGAEAFQAQANSLLDSQTAAIRDFLGSARAAGIDVSGIPLRIEPRVIDTIGGPHEQLPAVPAREVNLKD